MARKVGVLVCLLMALGGALNAQVGEKVRIGVIHLLAEHPDHIALREGFLKGMRDKGYDLEVTVFDANSEKYPETFPERAASEAQRMEEAGIRLIYGTGIYQAIKDASIKIPVIDSALIAPILLDYAVIRDGEKHCKANATGSLFGYAFMEIVGFARNTFPEAKKIAYLYNPNSPISRPASEIEAEAARVGMEVVRCPFTTAEEGPAAVEKAIASADVAFATNDIGVLGVEEEILGIAEERGFPVVVAIVTAVRFGALAAIQNDWFEAGKMCANQAEMILNGTPANTIPITVPEEIAIAIGINLRVAAKIGVEFSKELIKNAEYIVR
ncbi:MAG: hypothetical protein GY856_37240 [bacterium]|nr:hypothetical protein [bacterium]